MSNKRLALYLSGLGPTTTLEIKKHKLCLLNKLEYFYGHFQLTYCLCVWGNI